MVRFLATEKMNIQQKSYYFPPSAQRNSLKYQVQQNFISLVTHLTQQSMKKSILCLLAVSTLMACGGDEEVLIEDDVTTDIQPDELTIERAEKAEKVFQTVPSPFETATMFEEAGAEYNAAITNPVENVSLYTTAIKQALNLGVYGADLSYANIYDQSQESMFYMNCSKKMADALNVSAAFSPETVERLEENMNNRDSMMNIINDSYWICDAYLKENGQDHLSALIITGGWIEGLYLGTRSISGDEPNQELMQRIADQKHSLSNLMELLSSYEDEDVKQWLGKLQALRAAYDKIKEQEGEATVSDDDTPVIGGGSTLSFTAENITEIATATETLRNEIIQ